MNGSRLYRASFPCASSRMAARSRSCPRPHPCTLKIRPRAIDRYKRPSAASDPPLVLITREPADAKGEVDEEWAQDALATTHAGRPRDLDPSTSVCVCLGAGAERCPEPFSQGGYRPTNARGC